MSLGLTIALLIASGAYGLPQIKVLMNSIVIPIRHRPAPTGDHAAGRLKLIVPSTPGHADGVISLEIWYPEPLGAPAATIADVPPQLPLLLYAPGWGNRGTSNALLLADLARAGYVVAAFDDIGTTPEASPDAAANFDLTSQLAMRVSLALANRRLVAMVERATRSLDYLLALDRLQPGHTLAKRLNADRVGMLGFSFGGAVAAEMSRRDPRIRAAVNFDGGLFGEAEQKGARPPYLVVNSDFPNLEAATQSLSAAKRNTAKLTLVDRQLQYRQSCQMDFYALFYDEIEHNDLTDELFAPSLLNYLKHWRRTDERRQQIYASLRDYTLDFFGAYLKGSRPVSILDHDIPPYPFVHKFGSEQMPRANSPCQGNQL